MRRRARRSERHQASLPLASPVLVERQVQPDLQDPQGLQVQLERLALQDRLEPSVQRDPQDRLEPSVQRDPQGQLELRAITLTHLPLLVSRNQPLGLTGVNATSSVLAFSQASLSASSSPLRMASVSEPSMSRKRATSAGGRRSSRRRRSPRV